MADQTATYALQLKDGVSGGADNATDALKKLHSEIVAGTKALAEMQKALRNLKNATSPNVDEIGALEARIAAQRDAIASAQSSFINLGGVFKGKGPTEYQKKLSDLQSRVSQLPGPLGSVLGQLIGLSKLFTGGAMSTGMLAAAAGFLAITAGATAAIVALYKYGTAQADIRRTEMLTLDALAKAANLPGGGSDLQNAIDAVAATVPMARAEVAKLAQTLKDSGLRGKALEDALRGLSLKNTVGDASELMKSLTVQTEKLKESFSALFKDLHIDAWLSAWKEFSDLFSQTTATGRALKALVSTLLQPLIDSSTAAAPMLKEFFQDITIAALKLALVVLDLRDWFADTFGDGTLFDGLLTGETNMRRFKVMALGAFTAIGVGATLLAATLAATIIPAMWALILPMLPIVLAAAGIAVGVGTLIEYWDELAIAFDQVDWGQMAHDIKEFAVAFGTVLLGAVAMFAPAILPFVAAAFGLAIGILTLIEYWDELGQAFTDLDWAQLGKDIVNGLIEGLMAVPFVGAITELATNAYAAFQKAIGAHSPSTLFADLGATIPAGVAEGVEAGTPEAEAAASDMVSGAGAAAAGGRGGAPITIGEIHIHATTDKPQQMAMDFRRELERVLAGFASELGAPEAT